VVVELVEFVRLLLDLLTLQVSVYQFFKFARLQKDSILMLVFNNVVYVIKMLESVAFKLSVVFYQIQKQSFIGCLELE